MKKLNIFLIKSYIGPFVLTFFISLFVLLMQFLWKYIDDFVGKGFEWNVIAELMFYASATFVPMALPLAVLLSSLMTFGNLGEYYELVAIKSSGISLQRLMRPLIVLILFISFGAFYFSNNILPKANLEFYSLLSDVRQKKPSVSIAEGVFNSGIGDYVIKVGKKYPDGIQIDNIVIYDHTRKNGNTNVTLSQTGRMEMTDDKTHLVLTLQDGVNYDENGTNNQKAKHKKFPLQTTRFSKQIQRIDLSDFSFKKSDRSFRRNSYQMLNVKQLVYFEDSLALDKDSTLNVFVDFAKNEFSFLKLYEDTLGETHKPDVQVSSKRLADSLQKIVLAQEQEELIAQQKKDPEPVKPQNESKIHSKFSTAKINKELLAKRLQKNVITAEVSQSIVHDQPISKDSVFPLKADFLSNFDSLDQVRMVAGAFSLARNAAYQSTAILKRLDVKAKIISKYKVEWHRKFTLSFACIILFFIGAPLGAIIRKGGLGMPLVISILLFVAYHVLTIIGEKSVKSMLMDPFLGMWMSSLIFLPFGVFLTVKATSDAPLMDSEVWYRFVKRINILNRFKKNPKG